MPSKFFNRVACLVATLGQGTVTVGGLYNSTYLTPTEAGIATNDNVTYLLQEGSDFEIGRGVYNAGTVTRATVLVSKIAGVAGTTKMTLAGNAIIRMVNSAEDLNAFALAANLGTAAAENIGTSGATVPRLNGLNTWSKPQAPVAAALTSAVAADFTANQVWTANVSGSTFMIPNPSVAPPDRTYIGVLVTFATNNSLAFGSKFKTTGYAQSTSGKDHLVFQYDSGADLYYLVGARNGVAA